MVRPARQVFVISDIHLGGRYPESGDPEDRGFRISTQVSQLTSFVEALAARPAGEPDTELVINGDFIDFLAESDASSSSWVPFTPNPRAATLKLDAIVERDKPLFDALGRLLSNGHRLTILLGNHDLELALPQVRRRLAELMGVGGRHLFQFIYDGEAYVVGDALIEHGNRYDMFNVVDHDALRRYRSLLSRNQDVPSEYLFDAPTGSKIVASIMNPIKSLYPFIDLLKPETGAAVPILLALEPGTRKLLARMALLVGQARKHRLADDALPGFGGDIHADGISDEPFGQDIGSSDVAYGEMSYTEDAETREDDDPEAALAGVIAEAMGEEAESFLSDVEASGATADLGSDIGDDISTAEFIDRSAGLARLLLSRSDEDVERRLPCLLKAVRALHNDKSFDRSIESANEYLNAARDLAKGGFRCIVFGHTHLAKRVTLDDDCLYINSGTWADVMRFPTDLISGPQSEGISGLKSFVEDLRVGKLKRWIAFEGTYARLDFDASEKLLSAELCDFVGPEKV